MQARYRKYLKDGLILIAVAALAIVLGTRTHFIDRGEMRSPHNVGWQDGRGSQ